jgi:AcrR family transcriptional regulator
MVGNRAKQKVEIAEPPPDPDGGEADFRVRVAREKRERMRARLLNAIMKICSENKGRGPTVIDEVVQEAQVSRGTFYKYFDTLEDAMSELGRILTDDMVLTLSRMLDEVEDPAFRISCAAQIMMVHAALDHAWGGFVSHTGHLSEDSFLVGAVRLNCESGRQLGIFTYDSVEAAIDFHIGLITQSMRRMPRIGIDHDYIREVAAIALIGRPGDTRTDVSHLVGPRPGTRSNTAPELGPPPLVSAWRDVGPARRGGAVSACAFETASIEIDKNVILTIVS